MGKCKFQLQHGQDHEDIKSYGKHGKWDSIYFNTVALRKYLLSNFNIKHVRVETF
jgi:hypothetical protein